jgi:dTDP-4-amino-4,6-dideoxygalactose transaminase
MLAVDPAFHFSDVSRPKSPGTEKLFDNRRISYTYNGRGAIFHILRSLASPQRTVVLVPAFHCVVLVEAILRAGCQPRFYGVTEDLRIDTRSFLDRIDGKVAAAIGINYLGFPGGLSTIKHACEDWQIALIEDCSHSFFKCNPIELTGGCGDMAIYSFWKLIPSYAGGGFRVNNSPLSISPRFDRRSIVNGMVQLKQMFEQAMTVEPESLAARWFQVLENFRLKLKKQTATEVEAAAIATAETRYPFQPELAFTTIPAISRRVLQCSDLAEIAVARRRNFTALTAAIGDSRLVRPLFPTLSDRVVPYALPATVPNRSRHDIRLREKGVPLFTFGEILHPSLAQREDSCSAVRKVADRLSSELVCFSIHQDLSEPDARRFGDIIGEYSRNPF